MPIHDWSLVEPRRFQHFHGAWALRLCDLFNEQLLPKPFYAASETSFGQIEPDVLTFHARSVRPWDVASEDWRHGRKVLAVDEQPPQAAEIYQASQDTFVNKQKCVVIREAETEKLISIIEILSPGNKDSRNRMELLLRKVASVLNEGVHVMIIDLHAPKSLDPKGIHASIWEYLFGESLPTHSSNKDRTLVSYCADARITAYHEPVGIGDTLPDMPLFLDPRWYVSVPLERSYMENWERLPSPWKEDFQMQT
jgi:hypothetical protein